MKTFEKSYLRDVALKVLALLLWALSCSAQTGIVTGTNSTAVHGPDEKGRCWHDLAKGYNDLGFVEKQLYKVSCRKDPDTCNDYSMFGTKKEYTACPAPTVP